VTPCAYKHSKQPQCQKPARWLILPSGRGTVKPSCRQHVGLLLDATQGQSVVPYSWLKGWDAMEIRT
jgi:hypothetical protein